MVLVLSVVPLLVVQAPQSGLHLVLPMTVHRCLPVWLEVVWFLGETYLYAEFVSEDD